jgi:hypothetical protein
MTIGKRASTRFAPRRGITLKFFGNCVTYQLSLKDIWMGSTLVPVP